MALFLGAIVGIGILSLILSLFAYKNMRPNPRALWTVLTAFAIAVVLYGSQDGRYGEAAFIYGIGAFVIFFERRYHYTKNWIDDDDLINTFR